MKGQKFRNPCQDVDERVQWSQARLIFALSELFFPGMTLTMKQQSKAHKPTFADCRTAFALNTASYPGIEEKNLREIHL